MWRICSPTPLRPWYDLLSINLRHTAEFFDGLVITSRAAPLFGSHAGDQGQSSCTRIISLAEHGRTHVQLSTGAVRHRMATEVS